MPPTAWIPPVVRLADWLGAGRWGRLAGLILGCALAGRAGAAEIPTTADKIYSTEIHGRTYALLVPKGIAAVRGLIFYGPGVNGDSRSALGDAGYVAKSRILGYPVLTYDHGAGVVPAEANAAISNLAAQCGLAMDATTPVYAQGFSNGGGNAWAWPKSSPGRTLAYFVNKGVSAAGPLPEAALGIPGLNVFGDEESAARQAGQQRLFSNQRARGALLALVIEPGAGHGEYAEYVRLGDPFLWLLHSARNPDGKTPLVPVAEAAGWLADPDTRHEPMMRVYAYADYPPDKDKRQANWLYNRDLAYTYAAFCTFDKKVTLDARPAQMLYRDSDFRHMDLPATLNRAGDRVEFQVGVEPAVGELGGIEFYEYSRKLGDLPPSGSRTFAVERMTPGIHNYLALVRNRAGVTYISNSWTVYTEP